MLVFDPVGSRPITSECSDFSTSGGIQGGNHAGPPLLKLDPYLKLAHLKNGAEEGIRTLDLLLGKETLYH